MYPILESINKMWADARQYRDAETDIESVRAIAENQTIKLDQVMVNGDCRAYEVTWLKRCGSSATPTGSLANASCQLSADEVDSDKKTYNIASGFQDKFMVWDDECKDKFAAEEKIAYALMDCFKNLKTKVNEAAVAFLEANLQENVYDYGLGTVDGDTTYLPPNLWTPDIIAEFALTAKMNKIKDVVTLSGTNLWNAIFNSAYNASNDNQRDQLRKFQHFKRWYQDPMSVDTLAGGKATYLWDRGLVAFYTKNDYAHESPRNNNDPLNTITYSMPDKELGFMNNGIWQPAKYDINSQVVCKTLANGTKRFGRIFQVLLHFNLITSPSDCAGDTGILKFMNGNAPEPDPEP